MAFILPAMINLNGRAFTDESRAPVEFALDERATSVTLASGKVTKYIKYRGHNYTITWDNMPASASESVDAKAGRNELVLLVNTATIFTLGITDGHNATQTIDCLLSDYTESPAMRRSSMMRWNCKITLQEIGGS